MMNSVNREKSWNIAISIVYSTSLLVWCKFLTSRNHRLQFNVWSTIRTSKVECGFQDHSGQPSQELDSYFSTNFKDENGRWQVTTQDANKVLLDCYIRKNYFDLIDVDSFGSDSVFLGSALSALSYGGLIYATSTDGFSSGGHRPCK